MSINKDTARVIVTWECPRSCYYCANNGLKDKMLPEIHNFRHLPKYYDKIVITGGEPLLHASILDILSEANNHFNQVYINTAYSTDEEQMMEYLSWVDGLTYTVHSAEPADIRMLNTVQQALVKGFDVPCSNRLVINASILRSLPVNPHAWDSVELRSMFPPTEERPVSIASNETLFVLAKDYFDD